MTSILGLILGAALALQTPPADSASEILRRALSAPDNPAAVNAFLESLPKEGKYYVVEGDLLLTDDQVKRYLIGLSSSPRQSKPGPELIMNYVDGHPDYWENPLERNLTYWIDRASFGSEADVAAVRANLAAATRAWVDACPGCRISFTESSSAVIPSRDKRNFIVRRVTGGNYIAASFFRSSPDEGFYLRIDQSYFSTTFDKVGVLRHEMGHVLGYRHEHIQGIPGCRQEGGTWKPLSPYDAHSVMHYFCGGGGSIQLALSTVDVQSHIAAYQAPLATTPPVAATPAPTPGTSLVTVSLVGGNVSDSAVSVLNVLRRLNALRVREVSIKPGGSACEAVLRESSWPAGCSLSLMELLTQINGNKPLGSVVPGEVIRVPDIVIRPTQERREYNPKEAQDRTRRDLVETHWGSSVLTGTQVDPGSQYENLVLRTWELIHDTGSPELAARVTDAIVAAKIPNVFPKTIDRSPKVFHGSSFTKAFIESCGQGKLEQGLEVNLLNLLPSGSLPPRACSGNNCPIVVLVDADLERHYELDSKAKLPSECRLLRSEEFEKNRQHGTAMAGILAARANDVGIAGIDPGAEYVSVNWLPMNDYELGQLVEQRAATSPKRQQVYIFASQWDSHSARKEERALRSLASTKVHNLQGALWVASAGQSDSMNQLGVEIRYERPWAPMNLGDLPNVLVVTACNPCESPNAGIPSWANFSNTLVHVAAPGVGVLTASGESDFIEFTGTSPATAYVGGLAERLFATYPDYYTRPIDVKARLQYTSKPIVQASDASRLAAGVVDPQAALLDPNKTWMKGADAQWRPVEVVAWCQESIDLLHATTLQGLPTGHLAPAGLLRVFRHDPPQDVLKQPLWSVFADDPDPAVTELTIQRTGPGWVPEPKRELPLIKLRDGKTKALKDIWDLLGSPYISKRVQSCS